ncbi:MAG TPA: hypothetical protein VKA48_06860, partial [Gammaproteobacteria bacterium]|nr:hypothetical protein [Gammaproteobacteria bacterium]
MTALFVLLPIAAGLAGVFFLYTTALDQTKDRMQDTLRSHVRLMEVIASQDLGGKAGDVPDPSGRLALSRDHVRRALQSYPGIGKTGEFVLGHRTGNGVLVTFRQRAKNPVQTKRISPGNDPHLPIQRAVAGHSGVYRGKDGRGREVLAAYQPFPQLREGIVLKAGMAAIQAPYWRAAWLTMLCGGLLGLVGAASYLRVVNPLWRQLLAQKRSLHALLGNLPGMVFRCRNDPDWTMEFV